MLTVRFDLVYTQRKALSKKQCDACRRWIEKEETYLEGITGGGGLGAQLYPWRYHTICVPEERREKCVKS